MLRGVVRDVLADALLARAVRGGRPSSCGGSSARACSARTLERRSSSIVQRKVADGVVEAHRAANATDTSPASRAFATASLRFTSRVRPPERSWSSASTNGVTACPETPWRAASATASSIRSSDLDALRRRVREEQPARRRAASARPRRALPSDVVHALRHGRPAARGVEERQRVRPVAEHGDAERLEVLHRRRDVEERLRARAGDEHRRRSRARRGRRRRPVATGSRDGRRRSRPCRGSGCRRIRATASTPPTVVAPTSPATAHAARSRGPSLRALGVEARELVLGRGRRGSGRRATPIVAGVAPASRTACSISSPTSTPCGAGNPCATMRRLERDDRPALVERGANLVRELDELVHAGGRYRHRAELLDAAGGGLEREVGPADDPAGRERVSGARRVDEPRSTGSASRSSPSNEQPRAPRLRIQAASTSDRPTTRSSSSFAKTTSGCRRANGLAERVHAAVADRAPRREIDADAGTFRARELDRAQRGAPHRLEHERVAGDVEVVAAASHSDSISSARSSRAVPRSAAIERSPSGETSEQIDPVATLDRADDLDAVARRASSATSAPASSAPVFPMNRAEAPSVGGPRRDVRGLSARADPDLGVGVTAGGDRSGEPDDDVEGQISERADEHRERDRKIRAVDGGERRGGLRTFLLGGLVGASAAIAAVNRRRRAQRRRGRAARARGVRERAVLPRAPRARARRRPGCRADER